MQDHSDAARAVGPAIRWPSIDREAIGRIARATGWTMLLAAVAAVGTLAFLYVANHTEHTWRHAVRVVMLDLFGEELRPAEAESKFVTQPERNPTPLYPNGQVFSMKDFVAPHVLETVYERNRLADFGIDKLSFASAISVHHYAPTLELVLERYRDRLNNPRLSFTERQGVEVEFTRDLEIVLRKHVLLQLTLSSRFVKLSDAQAQKILADIAATWSQASIETLGVLKLPKLGEATSLLDARAIAAMDQASALHAVRQSIEAMRRQLQEMLKFAVVGTIVDEKSGHSLPNILRDLDRLEDQDLRRLEAMVFDLGIMGDAKLEMLTFRRRQQIAEAEAAALGRQNDAITQAIKLLTDNTSSAKPAQPPISDAQGGNSFVQFNSDILERFVTHVVKSSALDRLKRRQLIDEQVRLSEQIARAAFQLSSLSSLVPRLEAVAAASKPVTPAQIEQVKAALAAIVETINQRRAEIARTLDLVSTRRILHGGSLYADLELPMSQKAIAFHPVLAPGPLLRALAFVIALGALAFLAALARETLGRRNTTP